MGIKTLRCTTCGADIQLDDSREFGFCQYCGTKLMLVDKIEVKHSGTVTVEGIQSVEERIENYYNLFKNSFLEHDYKKSKELLNKILELDSKQASAYLQYCKILVVQPNVNIEKETRQFALYAGNCFKYAKPENKTKALNELTQLLDGFIDTLFEVMLVDNLVIVPFDSQTIYSSIPSEKYDPLANIDKFYLLIKECIDTFKSEVNESYSLDNFNKLWGAFYYQSTCKIVNYIINSLNRDESIKRYNQWISEHRNFVDTVTFQMINMSLWGYRSSLSIMFNKIPFKDLLKLIGEKIICVDKVLLGIKCSKGAGRAKSQLTGQQKTMLKNDILQIKNYLKKS